jgi:hypothetical protein
MAKRSLVSDDEVSAAVDGLLAGFGVPDDGRAVDDTGFGDGAAAKVLADGAPAGVAPSAGVEALWGEAPAPKKPKR